MKRTGGQGERALLRCAECGVELKAGLKYCDFCGRKVPEREAAAVSGQPAAPGALLRRLAGSAAAVLAIGALAYAGTLMTRVEPPPAAAPGQAQMSLAAATCENAIGQQVRAPFRVIAFRESRVGKEQEGVVVSGTVEVQSAAGEVQRRRYSCRLHPDERGALVLDEGKLN